jgi:hypothetical protein
MKTIHLITIFMLFSIATNVFSQYPNQQVTNNPYDQSETMIAVSPLNSMYIVGSWNDYRLDSNQAFRAGVGVSTNGGTNWSEKILRADSANIGLSGYQYGGNPSVAFDRYGKRLLLPTAQIWV